MVGHRIVNTVINNMPTERVDVNASLAMTYYHLSPLGYVKIFTGSIKIFQRSDNGVYECQVSTTPVMSHLVHLKVAGESENKG